MKSIAIVMMSLSTVALLVSACMGKTASAAEKQKAVLVVSFGTSYADTRKLTIEACEQKIRDAFPDYEVRRAFTSKIIVNVMKERDGIEVDSPEVALQKLHDGGYADVIVQPLHIIPGLEFHDLVKLVRSYEEKFATLRLGLPLLGSQDDYAATVNALKTQLPELGDHEAVLLMGHGTHHPANASYPALERVCEDSGLKNVFVGTVEGYPEIHDIIPRLQARSITKVTLMPFMLVAGDHAQNDMAGDEDDSWKSLLTNAGFEVEIQVRGLGENAAIQDIYVQHVKDALEK